MYYIRFLKPPHFTSTSARIKSSGSIIETLVTITSDLGDEIFPLDVDIISHVFFEGHEAEEPIPYQKHRWKAGMRALSLTHQIQLHQMRQSIRILVTSQDEDVPTRHLPMSIEDLPIIVPAWSGPFNLEGRSAARVVERHVRLPGGQHLCIQEEAGESIARHIWDAGLVLAVYLGQLGTMTDTLSTVLRGVLESTVAKSLRVLELGSGCGIDGMALATILPGAKVTLTDLPEAQAVLERNLSAMDATSRGNVDFKVLPWEDRLPPCIETEVYDLILLADCTYNPSSAPSLIKTLSALVSHAPGTTIVMATKPRHPSEGVFFELMADAAMKMLQMTSIPLPSAWDDDTATVDIYAFKKDENSSQ